MATEITQETLVGMWAGMPIPWTENDRFDEERYRDGIKACAEAGVPGFYSCGSTGEFYALDDEEFRRVNLATVQASHESGRPAEVGVTDVCTREVLRKVEYAVSIGADGIQTAWPFWLPLSDNEVVGFFRDIASAAPDMPIILYDTGRAKRDLSIEMHKRIREVAPGLIGSKFGQKGMDELEEYVKRLPWMNFLVGEPHLADGMMRGAKGCCSSIVYMCPKTILRYYDVCCQGKWEEARKIQESIARMIKEGLAPLWKLAFWDSAIDHLFAHTGGFMDFGLRCRGPYVYATEEQARAFKQWVEDNTPEMLHRP